ncbi:hypothetical protein FOPG_15491 [Fusarium oxysporum f. sp. conglutinans race 2 54008]|uniref:Uncharacterized protein n=1 Tax=Fusarium oxysporum f. sp. conglutinans race 2 54008 TaxID=1089457 RepID=X0GXU0_FUSOX|nr:hypothetical protein FOPG_15491 [Fusarium oxysporum f. sp. conglutinans race 2 54008]KAI8407907.1 hypothetical protein FOFC_10836 [Fusarium oxysporum]
MKQILISRERPPPVFVKQAQGGGCHVSRAIFTHFHWSQGLPRSVKQLFNLALSNFNKDEISRTLERGIDLECEDVYDLVNPFGDTRGRSFNSVWTFDLDKDVLFLTKHDKLCSAPLSLARDRLLTLDDFELVRSPTEEIVEEITVSAPYWDLQLDVDQRKKAFLGRILRDFAYAVIWIISMDFGIVERTGFEHVGGGGGRYVGAADLPRWDAPNKTIVQVGSCWFVLARNIRKGLAMIREHMGSLAAIAETTTGTASYAILTLRQIVCCKVHDGDLVYTRPESF